MASEASRLVSSSDPFDLVSQIPLGTLIQYRPGGAVVGLNQHKIWYSKVLLVNRRADLGTALFFENLGRYFWGPHAEAQN